ncbi:MAG: hypothetical protein M1826_003874, partial [Phylliscum demangeonii]
MSSRDQPARAPLGTRPSPRPTLPAPARDDGVGHRAPAPVAGAGPEPGRPPMADRPEHAIRSPFLPPRPDEVAPWRSAGASSPRREPPPPPEAPPHSDRFYPRGDGGGLGSSAHATDAPPFPSFARARPLHLPRSSPDRTGPPPRDRLPSLHQLLTSDASGASRFAGAGSADAVADRVPPRPSSFVFLAGPERRAPSLSDLMTTAGGGAEPRPPQPRSLDLHRPPPRKLPTPDAAPPTS